MIYNEENVELHFAVAYQEVSLVHSRRRDCGMRQRKKKSSRGALDQTIQWHFLFLKFNLPIFRSLTLQNGIELTNMFPLERSFFVLSLFSFFLGCCLIYLQRFEVCFLFVMIVISSLIPCK